MIEFTQFMRPNGRAVPKFIDRSKDIETKAKAVIMSGYRFTIEELTTGKIALYVVSPNEDADGPLCMELCNNGPEVPVRVDKMVLEAFAHIEAMSKL